MSYLVLALKWRPQRFSEVVGQDHVARTLANALKTGRAAQAYLFTGPRGVGKTTMARILAKALNCERGEADEPCNACSSCMEITGGRAMDVIEIDGASNRGIDDIRELRESARYAPAILSRKVYIIDEVHMLTQDAFNALLKTLEEPPRHVVFVLATTEPLKVPATILSRCQRFDFARMRAHDAAARMRLICESEGIGAEADALAMIARKGEGSMRDALTLLDQVVASGGVPITGAVVREVLGVTGFELFFAWSEAIADRDPGRALLSLAEAVDAGASLQELADQFLQHLRNLLVVATRDSLAELLEATEEERAEYLQAAARFSTADLLRHCRIALEAAGQMRRSAYPRIHLEVAIAEMCALPSALDLRRFIEVARGRFPEPATPPPAASPGAGAGPAGAGGVPPRAGTAGSDAGDVPGPGTEGASRRAPVSEKRGPGNRSASADANRSGGAHLSGDAIASGGVPVYGDAMGPGGALVSGDAIASGGASLLGEAFGLNGAPVSRESVGAGGPAAPGDVIRAGGESAYAAALPRVDSLVSVDSLDAPGFVPGTPGPSVADGAAAGTTHSEAWARVLAGVAAQKPALNSFLKGSELAGEEGKMVSVRVPGLASFAREQLERKGNKKLLMQLLEESLGRPVGVRFESGPVLAAEARGEGESARGAVPLRGAAASDPSKPVAQADRIQRLADLFGGEVIGPA